MNARKKPTDLKDEDMNEKVVLNSAALRIQRVYRGHAARLMFRKLQDENYIFLGMMAPVATAETCVQKRDSNFARRKGIQTAFNDEYLLSLINTKEKKVEGPEMKEELLDKFRQYYLEFKRVNGAFPDFPENEDFMRIDYKFGDKPRLTEAKEDTPLKKKTDKDEEDDSAFKLDASNYAPTLKLLCKQFSETWKDKEESANFAQKHDQEIVKREKRAELEMSVKEEVVDVLRDELEALKIAIEKDKGKKGKRDAKKKGKKDKVKGKKGEKDLTAGVPMESLVEELVQCGIYQQDVSFDAFHGAVNIMGQSTEKCPLIQPTLGELKNIMIEYGVLPLGYPLDVQNAIPIPSIMLYGAKGTGKTMIVNAIATATKASVFNLSPMNTANQYQGKAAVTKMLHTVFKVAKAKQPSIIYLDGFEMIFAKKIPKTDTSDPKRIKKDLMKQLKTLGSEFRVLVVMCSHKPWEGDVKAYTGLFDRILFYPKPDYQSRFNLWEAMISQSACETRGVDFSLLTKLSNGLSAGDIKAAVQKTLTAIRISQVRVKPLVTSEFTVHLAGMLQLCGEEDPLFMASTLILHVYRQDFMQKTPLAKKRQALMNPESVAGEAAKKDPKKK